MQGLVRDVARPVWQQKKLSMMLAKAKKTPDRWQRFVKIYVEIQCKHLYELVTIYEEYPAMHIFAKH